ncbi:MAG: thioether cross-link-forming SCIFF peptide maturase [Bacillota bacterium]|nr:thioether cross-link-forming SCIFF peptide maturase [Bacillota bacterium]
MTLIHKFIFDDVRIVLDVNSGSIHVVDQITWDYLDCLEYGNSKAVAKELLMSEKAYSMKQLQEVEQELAELEREGHLFSHDRDGQSYQVTPNPIVKALCLHVSHDCNLNCSYCFAGAGHFGGERQHMSAEVGKKAIDFLLKTSGPRNNCEIDFFGGEPLLNFPVVQELVAYGTEQAKALGKKIKFTLTTNGVLLSPEVEEFLNEHQMSVVLSIDGRPEVNDSMRPTRGGQGTYNKIMDNYQRFCSSRNHENYYLRGTFTGNNLDFSADVLHLADQGFPLLSVEPVVAPDTADYAFKKEDLPKLMEEYNKLTKAYYKRQQDNEGFEFFHFNLDLNRGPCLPKRLSGCGAGHEYLAVTPEGDLYPCHQFVGQEEFCLGNLDQGLVRQELSQQFQQAHIYNKEECKKCWARFYCSGGCHANNYHEHQDIHQVYEIGCQLAKKRIECAIYLQVKKALTVTG